MRSRRKTPSSSGSVRSGQVEADFDRDEGFVPGSSRSSPARSPATALTAQKTNLQQKKSRKPLQAILIPSAEGSDGTASSTPTDRTPAASTPSIGADKAKRKAPRSVLKPQGESTQRSKGSRVSFDLEDGTSPQPAGSEAGSAAATPTGSIVSETTSEAAAGEAATKAGHAACIGSSSHSTPQSTRQLSAGAKEPEDQDQEED